MSLLPFGGGQLLHAQHGRDVRAVDIGVQQADARAALRQGHGNVDGDGGFADAALARADGDGIADGHVDQPAHAAVVGDIRVPV